MINNDKKLSAVNHLNDVIKVLVSEEDEALRVGKAVLKRFLEERQSGLYLLFGFCCEEYQGLEGRGPYGPLLLAPAEGLWPSAT